MLTKRNEAAAATAVEHKLTDHETAALISKEAALAQVDRILASASFRGSKRCATFLRHAVTRALDGRPDTLKERLIGAEVFGRDPGYDTAEDPVVRAAAGEVRKRLAQYYQEPAHTHELRVDLPAGTYIPQFHLAPEIALAPSLAAAEEAAPRKATWLKWAALVIAVLGLSGWGGWAFWPVTAVDAFWQPVLRTPGPVLVCIGTPAALTFTTTRSAEIWPTIEQDPNYFSKHPNDTVPMRDLVVRPNRFVAFQDSVALSRVAVLLSSKSKPYHVRGGGSTTFTDLRDNATVLIGAFSNDWTVKLGAKSRYYFDRNIKTGVEGIYDHNNPGHGWSLVRPWPDWQVTEDYALVSRVFAPETGHVVVMVAGITQFGTFTAGECVASESCLSEALKQAPPGWKQQNMQVVLETKIVENNPGPPRIVAVHFW